MRGPVERRRLAAPLRPNSITVIPDRHDGDWEIEGPLHVSHVYLTNERLEHCRTLVGGRGNVELMKRVGSEDAVTSQILAILSDPNVIVDPAAKLLVDRAVDLLCIQLLRWHSVVQLPQRIAYVRGGLARWQLRRVTDYMLAHLRQTDRPRPAGGANQPQPLPFLHGLPYLDRIDAACLANSTTHDIAQRLLSDPNLSISEIALAVRICHAVGFRGDLSQNCRHDAAKLPPLFVSAHPAVEGARTRPWRTCALLRRGNGRNIAIAFAIRRQFRIDTKAMTCFTDIARRETIMSKCILVTGAGSEFGKAASIGMAKNGHSVIATTQVSSQVTPLREEAKALGIEKSQSRTPRPHGPLRHCAGTHLRN